MRRNSAGSFKKGKGSLFIVVVVAAMIDCSVGGKWWRRQGRLEYTPFLAQSLKRSAVGTDS
jgi:hypothetical protein